MPQASLKPQTLHLFDKRYGFDFFQSYRLEKPQRQTSAGLLVARPRATSMAGLQEEPSLGRQELVANRDLLVDYMQKTVASQPTVDMTIASRNVHAFNRAFPDHPLPHPCYKHPDGLLAQWDVLVQEIESVRYEREQARQNTEVSPTAILFDTKPQVLDRTYLASVDRQVQAEFRRLQTMYSHFVLPVQTLYTHLLHMPVSYANGFFQTLAPDVVKAIACYLHGLEKKLKAMLDAANSDRYHLVQLCQRADVARGALRDHLETGMSPSGLQFPHLLHVGKICGTTQAVNRAYQLLCDLVLTNAMALRTYTLRPHRQKLKKALIYVNQMQENLRLHTLVAPPAG